MNVTARSDYPTDAAALGAMHRLITHYLHRQSLVALAMLEVHPGALQLCGKHLFRFEIEPFIYLWQRRTEHMPNWRAGIWQREWRYQVHGAGCRLVHVRTGEPIGWEPPDLAAFREADFWRHLAWRIETRHRPALAAQHMDWLKQLFFILYREELLLRAGPEQLRLPARNASQNASRSANQNAKRPV